MKILTKKFLTLAFTKSPIPVAGFFTIDEQARKTDKKLSPKVTLKLVLGLERKMNLKGESAGSN